MNGQASPGVEPPGRRRGMPAGTLNGEALGGRPHEWRDSIEHGHNPSQQIYFNDSQNENSAQSAELSHLGISFQRSTVAGIVSNGVRGQMISISGTFGVGLYVGSGTILRQAGPGGVLLSFSLIGLVSWAVMQCIAEMLCIWPISGALMEFVATFVDKELAITCGVAYWFTYAISMAAIITGTAGESNYFDPGKPLQGVVFFCAMPILMILLNSVSVKAYGLVELISGVLKILFISTIIVIMFAINLGVYNNGNFFAHDSEAAENWGFAFLNSLSIATFAFVGVETTAATALEARLTVPMGGENPSTRSLKNVATRVPILAAVLYFFGSLFVTLNMQWDDRNLPRASWIPLGNDNVVKGTSNSAFVIIATESKIKGLPGVVTVFLLFTGLTAANTQVYIASRTLFSLTRDIEASAWWSCLGYFGRTNDRMIPMRALLASCIFLPIPFAYLSNKAGTTVQDVSLYWTSCPKWALSAAYWSGHASVSLSSDSADALKSTTSSSRSEAYFTIEEKKDPRTHTHIAPTANQS
ncbi:MAG: hypothetical protein M1819_001476 [Sarea resinae]|nr:MAG: hypothetical protein M1819_001476 [Sarea resinae]